MTGWLARLGPDRLGGQTLIAFGLKGVGAVASFALSWLIARAFGAEGAGLWGLAIATTTLVSTVVVCGLDTQLLRVVAGDRREGRDADAVAATRALTLRLMIVAMAAAAALWAADGPIAFHVLQQPDVAPILALLAWTIPALVAVRLASVALRASGRLFASQLIDGPLGTGGAALMVGAAYAAGRLPTLDRAGAFMILGTGIAAAVAWALYGLRVARHAPGGVAPPLAPLLLAGVPVLLSGLTNLFTDWFTAVMVGRHWPVAEVGLLRVATQFVMLASLVQLAMEAVTGPRIAAAARMNDLREIASVTRRAVAAVMLLAAPLFVALLVFPAQLLRLFGPEFAAGAAVLQVLAIGQAVRLAAGPLGTILIMTGHQRWVLAYAFVGVALCVGFTLWLVPLYGALGAAAAASATMVFRNLAALWMVRRVAGVRLFERRT